MKIVYTVSEMIAPYLHASIDSLLDHNEVEKIYVFTDAKEIKGLPDVCEVRNITEQEWMDEDSPNVCELFPLIARIRLCMAKLLPEEHKVLYLDADTIICDSLEPVWDTDMSGRWLAMVDESLGKYKPFGEYYFNCGVVLFNLDKIREDKIDDKWIRFFNRRYIWLGEQDILNKFNRRNRIACLPSRYNEFHATGISDNPAIVHYACFSDWYENRDMPRVEYLDRYLRRENEDSDSSSDI